MFFGSCREGVVGGSGGGGGGGMEFGGGGGMFVDRGGGYGGCISGACCNGTPLNVRRCEKSVARALDSRVARRLIPEYEL